MKKDRATVETPSPIVAENEAKRQLCRDLVGGTDKMIGAGVRWLIPHPGEMEAGQPNANYQIRLKSNILTNFLSDSIDKQVGKIFSKPIELAKDVAAEIAAICENIDRQGRNLNSFMMDVSKAAFCDGIGYILADYPKVSGVRTAAEEKALGVRPYAVHIKAHNLLEVLSEQIGGVETITRIRIKEEICKPSDGWNYEEVEQVRVLRREDNGAVVYELWQENEDEEWIQIEEGATAFQSIYLIPVYTNRTGFMQGLPPNQAVAELNLRHWRSMSEQINALSFQRFAMLSATGVTEDSIINIGPSKLLRSNNPEAKFTFVEPTGKGVEMGRLDLESIEAAIQSAPVNTRIENGGKVTATAAAIDSAEANAGLKAIAQGIQDSIEQLFMAFAEMMGMGSDAGGEVVVNTDFAEKHGTDAGLTSIDKARALGDISKAGYLNTLKWRGELPSEFDIDADIEASDSELPSTLGGEI